MRNRYYSVLIDFLLLYCIGSSYVPCCNLIHHETMKCDIFTLAVIEGSLTVNVKNETCRPSYFTFENVVRDARKNIFGGHINEKVILKM